VRAEPLLVAALGGESVPWPADAGRAFENAVFEAAIDHGVAALLASATTATTWPGRLHLALQDARRLAAATEVLERQDLMRVVSAFGQADVRCLLLKGAPLAYTHYRHPWLRPRFDTDLLVDLGERARADAVLRGLGYVPSPQVSGTLVSHQRQYQRRNRHGLADTVDLHWKVTNPHVFADTLTFDELWTPARAVPQLGGDARTLADVHALILACVHRVAHHQNYDRLIWSYDIHLLVSGMDRRQHAEFLELACVKRLRSICAAGLDSAQRRFGTRQPAGWRDRLQTGSDGEVEPTAAFLQQGLRRIDILRSDLRAVRGWTRKIRLVREHLFPPADFVRARYGSDTPMLFAYVDRILGGVGKWFRAPS
jgi:hypothetical protein